MNHSFRILSIIVALGLLVAVIGMGPAFFGARPVFAAAVTVAEDDVEPAKWYRKAAEQGYNLAQSNLIKMIKASLTGDFPNGRQANR